MPNEYEILAMSDAQVFAALAAIPERFRFEVERVTRREPDPFLANAVMPTEVDEATLAATLAQHERDLVASMRERVFWRVTIAAGEYRDPSFTGSGPTLATAYHIARRQIAAFAEVLS